jgi:hypothetical protein
MKNLAGSGSLETMTPEERSERSRKAALAAAKRKAGAAQRADESPGARTKNKMPNKCTANVIEALALPDIALPDAESDKLPAGRAPAWRPYVTVAILVAIYLFPWARILSDGVDEGISLLGAARVLGGQIPAHDFVETIGPGEFYWLALFFKLFGTTIGVAHFELLMVGVALSTLVFHLARRVGADPVLSCALVTVVSIPLFAINSYHWDSDLFALLSIAALIEWQRSSRSFWLLLSGASAGATTLIMQQKGFLLCCSILLSAVLIARSRWRKSFTNVLVPYAAILAVVIAFYAAHGAFRDLVWANIMWPITRYSAVSKCPYGLGWLHIGITDVSTVVPGYAATPTGWFLFLPIFLVVALPALLILAIVHLRRRAIQPKLLPFWFCGTALCISEWQRPDVYHLVFGCSILLITFLALLPMIHSRRWLTKALLTSALLFGAVNQIGTLAANQRIETRRGVIYSRNEDRALQFLQQHTLRGEPVFIYPYRPVYNFLSHTENPTRFSYFLYGWHTPAQFKEAVGDLEAKRVRYVLWDTTQSEHLGSTFPLYRPPPRSKQLMERYLESRYHQIAFENGLRVMERIPNPEF